MTGFFKSSRRVPGPRRSVGVVGWLAGILLALALVTGIGFYLGMNAYNADGPLTADTNFTVERGMSAADVGEVLEGKGVVSNRWFFTFAAWVSGDYRRIKAGEYLALKSSSIATVLDMIVKGKEFSYRVTIPEGWTTEMAMERLNATGALEGTPVMVPAEGSLLPDTYAFPRGYARAALIAEMQAAQKKLLDELWPKRASDLPFDKPEEAITLASIVEKETSVPAERAKVAAVFVNRLKKGMRLQSDPTVIYGIVGGKGKLDRPLSKADLRNETPWNTYRVDGLPPGPIANPGRDSIAAVLNPANTKDLYFVADGSGGHVFAESLSEHNSNVKEWRELQKRLAEEAIEGAPAAPEADDAATASTTQAPAAAATTGTEGLPVPVPPVTTSAPGPSPVPVPEAKPQEPAKPAFIFPLPKPRPKKT